MLGLHAGFPEVFDHVEYLVGDLATAGVFSALCYDYSWRHREDRRTGGGQEEDRRTGGGQRRTGGGQTV